MREPRLWIRRDPDHDSLALLVSQTHPSLPPYYYHYYYYYYYQHEHHCYRMHVQHQLSFDQSVVLVILPSLLVLLEYIRLYYPDTLINHASRQDLPQLNKPMPSIIDEESLKYVLMVDRQFHNRQYQC